MTITAKVDSIALKRRAEASIGVAGVLAGLFACFATVPISIRQRDWKVWVLPFAAGLTVIFTGTGKETEGEQAIYKLAGWATQGALCGVLLAKNKEEAKLRLEQEGAKIE
tara:strand:- start:282 stop:611 length:330 start_codon:yes stop_codon:yes gene_type:complete